MDANFGLSCRNTANAGGKKPVQAEEFRWLCHLQSRREIDESDREEGLGDLEAAALPRCWRCYGHYPDRDCLHSGSLRQVFANRWLMTGTEFASRPKRAPWK